MVLACLSAVPVLAGCGRDADRPAAEAGRLAVPGPVHVHGLGVNPRDGALFLATHTGLFRSRPGTRAATRVTDRYQDTMGFAVTGPDEFLGSGHPDGRENLPPFLGLIRSGDAGRTWEPVSLRGKVDLHLIEAAGRRVYAYGSDFDSREPRFLTSDDRGRSWERLRRPAPVESLALDPADPRRLAVASGAQLFESIDAGRSWQKTAGRAGLLAWQKGALLVLDAAGVVWRGRPGERRWERTGDVGGAAAVFEAAADGALYAALHDGAVKASRDGGRSWTVRVAP